jgi:hypothetical protein
MILVSNGEPRKEEFQDFMEARKQANAPTLTMDFVMKKKADIIIAKKYVYNPEEIEQIVNSKIENKLKTGNLGGFNLSYMKINLKNDLAGA